MAYRTPAAQGGAAQCGDEAISIAGENGIKISFCNPHFFLM
jgi:hypothetical protein